MNERRRRHDKLLQLHGPEQPQLTFLVLPDEADFAFGAPATTARLRSLKITFR
ncbi:hypothetical protein HYD27_16775 [Paenibacillus sp. S150]|nr:hypothetical protein [Paenibacillus sp. S150]